MKTYRRTAKQIRNLVTRITDECNGDTTGLEDWLIEGNRVGGLTGRSDHEIITEWNALTDEANGR